MPRTLECRTAAERAEATAAAARTARNGRLVALPAEHGYVLASDAFAGPGVAALRAAKGLSATTSMGVLVGHAGGVHGIASRVGHEAQDLISAFWPGLLSLVLRVQPALTWSVPTDRCVVRMPLHPVLLDVAAAVGPMVSSACSEVEREAAALFLDSGPRPAGPGSTVIDATGPRLVVLRLGAVDLDALHRVVPYLEAP